MDQKIFELDLQIFWNTWQRGTPAEEIQKTYKTIKLLPDIILQTLSWSRHYLPFSSPLFLLGVVNSLDDGVDNAWIGELVSLSVFTLLNG